MVMRYYAPLPGGEPFWPRGPHAMRVGDAERDAAAADLGEHYTAGRLTLEELHERLEAVFAAKTFGQLARIMSDLPGSGRLAGLARPFGPPVLPGTPAWPWMPVSAPRYHWDGYWNPNGGHGAAMGPAAAGFSPGEEFGPGGQFQPRNPQSRFTAGGPGGQVRRALAAGPGHADLAVHRPAVRQARRSVVGPLTARP